MKRIFKITMLFVFACFVLSGGAIAKTFTYMDNTINWPGYDLPYGDEYGTPKIASMTVTINDNSGYLESVVIKETERRVWDALFINADASGEPYYQWDYYVQDNLMGDGGAKLYKVKPDYQYIIVTGTGRKGHPAGIQPGGLYTDSSTVGVLYSVHWDGSSTLTYNFNPGIQMSSHFVIGYTPWCANDVIITPEPATLILLGFGLIGIGIVSRKRLGLG